MGNNSDHVGSNAHNAILRLNAHFLLNVATVSHSRLQF